MNSTDVFNESLNSTEERISKLEDRSEGKCPHKGMGRQKFGKQRKEYKMYLGYGENIQCICILESQKERRRQSRAEVLFETTKTEKFAKTDKKYRATD